MDMARAEFPPTPQKVNYMSYMGHFCSEFNKKSPIYTEISTVTFFYIAYVPCHFVSISRKKSLHGVQTEFSATLTDITEPYEV